MIHHTVNNTTITVGQCTATVIAHTNWETGIVTFELVYPRYIHSELLTHRMASRNASSSRATPISIMCQEVRNDPVFFDFIGLNQAGMVAGEQLDEKSKEAFRREWEALGCYVADMVEEWSKRFNIHKQTLNRVLEPWSRIRTLFTMTEDNLDHFFKLRLAEDAQPEMRSLAQAMKLSLESSQPVSNVFHLPYITEDDFNDVQVDNVAVMLKKCLVSAARCARVSYARLDGKETTIEDDLALSEKLMASGHLSPFEHPAFTSGGEKFANFTGWRSFRNLFLEH